MNCQGCEYDVLRALADSPASLRRIDAIEVQFHAAGTRAADANATSADLYCPIERMRLRGGLLPVYRYPFVFELWERNVSSKALPPLRALLEGSARLPPVIAPGWLVPSWQEFAKAPRTG